MRYKLTDATPTKYHAPYKGCGTFGSKKYIYYDKFVIEWHGFHSN